MKFFVYLRMRNTKGFIIIVGFLTLLMSGICKAEDTRFVVSFDVKNAVTHHAPDYIRCHVQQFDDDEGRWVFADIPVEYINGIITATFDHKPQNGKYRVYVRKMLTNRDGGKSGYDNRYETGYVSIDVPQEAESEYQLPTFYITLKQPKERELDLQEVTVTATKVKFYYKGDTLVYNADAFLLADGSMLDDILKQMPGVEMKANGVILCNGRRIQSLLLNGKDVFNGKFGEMLDNLPAYTVKDIAVYDKKGRVSEMMGIQTGDASYVMDVRLKRDYAHGLMTNVDVGYGTENRYLAKLFALWFSDNVTISANAVANNLSDNRNPAEKDDLWSSSQMSNGLFSTHSGGINYVAKGDEDKWEIKGSVDLSHNENIDRQTSSTEYFNGGGSNSTFTYSVNDMNMQKLRVNTNHEFLYNISKVGVIKVKPRFYYNRNKKRSDNLRASFHKEVENWNPDSLENLYSPFSTLTDDVINRLREERLNEWNGFSGAVDFSGYWNLNSSGQKNMLMTQVFANYTSNTENEFNRYALNFGAYPLPDEVSHMFYQDSPDYNLEAIGKLEFTHYFKLWSLRLPIAYKFHFTEDKKDSRAYNLEQLAEYSYQHYPLEFRPDEDALNGLLNPLQSYTTLGRAWVHSLDYYCDNLSRIYLPGFSEHYISFTLSGGFSFVNQAFEYLREHREYYKRNDYTYNVSLHTALRTNKINAWEYTMLLQSQSGYPNLNVIASLPSRDPLEIQAGASSLKLTHSHNLTLGSQYKGSGSRSHRLHLSASYATAPFYTRFDINQATGIQTITRANGKFRLDSRLGYSFSMPLRYNSPFTISNSLSTEYQREILNIGYTSGSIVDNLKFSYQGKTLRLSAFADGQASIYDYGSQLEKLRTLQLKYGLDGLVKLPKGWDISTDLTFFTRRGFMNSAYNTTESVWNLHASKSLLKGSLIVALDAYDILRQVSHVTYILTPQLRAETNRNGVPAYFLLHLRYHFHKTPKR